MIHYLFIIILTLLPFKICAHPPDKHKAKEILADIPAEDQKYLEIFFRHLVAYNNFGYVTLGNKPMVWVQLSVKGMRFDKNKAQILKYNPLSKGYQVWLKYQHLFPIRQYIFRSYPLEDNDSLHMIIFLKKKKVLNVIKDNISLFKEKLGSSITPEQVLDDLQKKNDILNEVFCGHHDLLGIVLGFGVHNSKQFQKRYSIFRSGLLSPPYDNEILKKIYGFNAIVLDEIYFNLTPFPHVNNNLCPIDLPRFAEDSSHPESALLRKQFFNDQKLIKELYSQDNFLEIFFESLIEKN